MTTIAIDIDFDLAAAGAHLTGPIDRLDDDATDADYAAAEIEIEARRQRLVAAAEAKAAEIGVTVVFAAYGSPEAASCDSAVEGDAKVAWDEIQAAMDRADQAA